MSWEVMYDSKEIATCACGKGIVSRCHCHEGDDWNRYRDSYHDNIIECEECRVKYHIETRTERYFCMPWDGDGIVTRVYLVPNGKSLNITTEYTRLPFEQFADFRKHVVALYSKEQLVKVLQEMEEKKYSTRLESKESLEIVREHERWEKSRNLKTIGAVLRECITQYDEYEWTLPKVKAFRDEEAATLKKNKEQLQVVLSESHELEFKKA